MNIYRVWHRGYSRQSPEVESLFELTPMDMLSRAIVSRRSKKAAISSDQALNMNINIQGMVEFEEDLE